jgi:hypothetical protein
MDPDPDPGGPKTCGSGSGFGTRSTTLVQILIVVKQIALFFHLPHPGEVVNISKAVIILLSSWGS